MTNVKLNWIASEQKHGLQKQIWMNEQQQN